MSTPTNAPTIGAVYYQGTRVRHGGAALVLVVWPNNNHNDNDNDMNTYARTIEVRQPLVA